MKGRKGRHGKARQGKVREGKGREGGGEERANDKNQHAHPWMVSCDITLSSSRAPAARRPPPAVTAWTLALCPTLDSGAPVAASSTVSHITCTVDASIIYHTWTSWWRALVFPKIHVPHPSHLTAIPLSRTPQSPSR